MVVLVAVAALAGVAVRTVGEQAARQSAEADANFAASVAAMEIARDLLLMHEVTAKLRPIRRFPPSSRRRTGPAPWCSEARALSALGTSTSSSPTDPSS